MAVSSFQHLLARRWLLWLAVWLTLFSALAPSLSHALVWQRGAPASGIEICTSSGPRWVADSSSSVDSHDGQESAAMFSHCPFCLQAAERAAPPPLPLVHLFDVLGEHRVPTISQAFFFLDHFALTPPLRGPPSIS
jgi:hypothetical protein